MDGSDKQNLSILNKLQSASPYHDKWARSDFIIYQTTKWASILASAAAAVGTASLGVDSILPPAFLAILAGIPALCLSIQSEFKFNRRAAWHWGLKVRIEALCLEIESGITDEKKAIIEYNEMRIRAEDEWEKLISDTPGMVAPVAPHAKTTPEIKMVDGVSATASPSAHEDISKKTPLAH